MQRDKEVGAPASAPFTACFAAATTFVTAAAPAERAAVNHQHTKPHVSEFHYRQPPNSLGQREHHQHSTEDPHSRNWLEQRVNLPQFVNYAFRSWYWQHVVGRIGDPCATFVLSGSGFGGF